MHILLREAADGERVVSLDAEWDTSKDSRGHVSKSQKVALIQLGYFDDDKTPRALLLQVQKLKPLPREVLLLLGGPSIAFIGRAVGQDIAKIGKDFSCADLAKIVASLDLDTMAKERGVVGGRESTL